MKADIRTVGPGAFVGVDAICDLAALCGDPVGELDRETTLEINVKGRERVARLAREMGVRRYVLASSCSVYGASPEIVDETSPVRPSSTYAQAAVLAESAVLPLNSDAFCVTALRQATVYGLSPRMRLDLVLNAMTHDLTRLGRIRLQRDGRQWRPLVHVKDTARAFITVLEAEGSLVAGRVYNVGSDHQNIQMLELAERVAAVTGRPFRFTWYGIQDHRSYRVRFAKFHSELGFSPKFEIEDGIREIAEAVEAGRIARGAVTRNLDWYKRHFGQIKSYRVK